MSVIRNGRRIGSEKGPRPHTWCTGPDPELHEKHKRYRQQKNQAQWRGETWLLSFETWCALWGDLYRQRGRTQECYCLTRIDYADDWVLHNIQVITRRQHSKENARKGRELKL